MAHFDPYALLGVTVDSSLNDIRRAYYRLALLIHPDKGGNVEDMYILESSYKWIEEKHKASNEKQKTLEVAEKEFEDFITEQEKHKLPSLDDILIKTLDFDYDTFFQKVWGVNEKTKNTKVIPAAAYEHVLWTFKILTEMKRLQLDSINVIEMATKTLNDFLERNTNEVSLNSLPFIQHGYGDDMVKDETSEVRAFTKDEIVVYKEPESYFKPKLNYGTDTTVVDKLDDYTTKTNKLYMSDYKQAFKELDDKSEYSELFGENKSLDVLLATKEIERELII